MVVTYSMYTDTGDREKNEDEIGRLECGSRQVFMLADGLGGHGMGELASGMAVDTVKELYQGDCETEDMLSQSFEEAQRRILESQNKKHTQGMKTTLVVLEIDGDAARWAHIGDSRLYHFRRGRLVCRTFDHSVPQMLVYAGKLKEKHIREHEDRNKLLRVLGSPWGSKSYECSEETSIDAGHAFLLCSDGFWELIDEKEMCRLLKKADSAESWLDSMRELAWKHGEGKKKDNNSAIAVWIS